jgi:hypothetical protein
MPHTGTVGPNGRPSLGMERLGFQNRRQGRGVIDLSSLACGGTGVKEHHARAAWRGLLEPVDWDPAESSAAWMSFRAKWAQRALVYDEYESSKASQSVTRKVTQKINCLAVMVCENRVRT